MNKQWPNFDEIDIAYACEEAEYYIHRVDTA